MDLLSIGPAVRFGSFAAVLFVMVVWEFLAARRPIRESHLRHKARNLAVAGLDALLVRFLMPVVPVGFAAVAEERSWGLFHQVALPSWAAIVLSIVLFDLAIYLQHVLFHAVPALWRVHRVHHSDLELDATSGLRFHPVEILLSLGIKLALVALVGPPAIAVMLFEVILNATAVFNHANVRLPLSIDRWLRWIIVTPDMHRVHHSVVRRETDSNFGFNLTWWDRILGTYRAHPAAGHEGMTIGLNEFKNVRDVTLVKVLVMPFRRIAPADGAEEGKLDDGGNPRTADGEGGPGEDARRVGGERFPEHRGGA